MAEQLYLENIDEFVTDQNKIVRSWDRGRRMRGVLGLPGRGGVSTGCLCLGDRPSGHGAPRRSRGGDSPGGQSLSRASKSAGPGRARGALGAEPGKLAGLVRPPPRCPVG